MPEAFRNQPVYDPYPEIVDMLEYYEGLQEVRTPARRPPSSHPPAAPSARSPAPDPRRPPSPSQAWDGPALLTFCDGKRSSTATASAPRASSAPTTGSSHDE